MITGTYVQYPSDTWLGVSGGHTPIEFLRPIPSGQKRNYFVCESCGSRYLLPEIRGTELIRLVCSGCGGRLKEE